MPGFGILNDPLSHKILINIDRVCAITTVIVCCVYTDWSNMNWWLSVPIAVIAGISAILSELISVYCGKYEKWIHVVCHSVWHITVFELARELAVTNI